MITWIFQVKRYSDLSHLVVVFLLLFFCRPFTQASKLHLSGKFEPIPEFTNNKKISTMFKLEIGSFYFVLLQHFELKEFLSKTNHLLVCLLILMAFPHCRWHSGPIIRYTVNLHNLSPIHGFIFEKG